MYSRPPSNRFPRGMRVPENYSGNAFSPANSIEKEEAEENERSFNDISDADIERELDEQSIPASVTDKGKSALPSPSPSFRFDLGRFFPTNRSFGMEEFLIIALILLLAQNDTDDDTLIFLILLLFIK